MRAALLCLLTATLSACSVVSPDDNAFRTVERELLPAPPGPAVARVSVVGPTAAPFLPTPQVWWSPTQHDTADDYATPCADASCMSWEVTGAEPGVVYVWAQHQEQSRLCFRVTSDVEPVEVAPGSVTAVELVLGDYVTACE